MCDSGKTFGLDVGLWGTELPVNPDATARMMCLESVEYPLAAQAAINPVPPSTIAFGFVIGIRII
jgi:hypothetical protein